MGLIKKQTLKAFKIKMQNKGTKAGQMRLQREAKMAARDIQTQLKKTGKINDGFICLPDPEDCCTWYYIVFGLDYKEFKGGFYMGKIICPPEYPAKAPKDIVLTTNGRFHTWNEGICLSVSDYHPESWNPVWKVSQIVIGLTSFWQTSEDTYGGVYSHEVQGMCKNGETKKDALIRMAKESRDWCLKHEKFALFKEYAGAIGIDKVPEIEGWEEHQKKQDEALRVIAERKAKEEAEKKAKEEAEEAARKAREQKELQAKAVQIHMDYFQLIAKMGLNKPGAGKQNKAKAA